ncbi:hypothetical protein BY458DRAFT_589868 [Sporodiniella umbellata]|nr:hypothetical protein BY458DRAFT_589868 [Sporodiniella umbellata]
MTATEYNCDSCEKNFARLEGLKTHKRDFHIDKVFVGQSRIPISRTNVGFICPACDKRLTSTRRFKDHLKHHDLSLHFAANNSNPASDEENKDKDETSSVTMEHHEEQLDALPQLLPPPPLVVDDASVQRKRRKTLSFTETILAASDAISMNSQSQQDKIKLAQIGRWVPIVLNCEDSSYGFLTSSSTSSIMLKNKSLGTWESPIDDPITATCSINQIDNMTLIEHIKTTSEAAKILSTTRHSELTEQQCNILNQDWLQYPQLRYCGSQLLAGSILVQDQAAILLNTIEPYSRDSLLDAHYERRSSRSASSFPSVPNQYGYFSILLLSTTDGDKLVIGTRTCNFLVTSSIRLDKQSVNLGSVTSHFMPTRSTKIFLDIHSVGLAMPLLNDPSVRCSQSMPSLYQLKQVRSKFDQTSTYTMCRASSAIASSLELQPSSIWTLSDQDSNNAVMSQEKIGSLMFRTIAIQVIKDGENATPQLPPF